VELSRPLTDRHEICTEVWCGVKSLNLYFENLSPNPKKVGGENFKIAYSTIFRTGVLKSIEGLQLRFKNIEWHSSRLMVVDVVVLRLVHIILQFSVIILFPKDKAAYFGCEVVNYLQIV